MMRPVQKRTHSKQTGASLVVALLMLVAVMLLGVTAAKMALQGEKASRGDRDRQIAFQAAEAALMDAEIDIEASSDANSRSAIFKEVGVQSSLFIQNCGAKSSGNSWGLCQPAQNGQPAVWLSEDIADDDASTAKSVPYGYFTGQTMQTRETAVGPLPAKLPRYIIEIFQYNQAGSSTESTDATYYYRVTAIGFGSREATQVVLQMFYRKIERT